MNRNERIFTKREIIIFSIISLFFSNVLLIDWIENETSIWGKITDIICVYFVFFIPSILAILLNLIFKLADIQNKTIIKNINIIFSIFATFYLFLVWLYTYIDFPFPS